MSQAAYEYLRSVAEELDNREWSEQHPEQVRAATRLLAQNQFLEFLSTMPPLDLTTHKKDGVGIWNNLENSGFKNMFEALVQLASIDPLLKEAMLRLVASYLVNSGANPTVVNRAIEVAVVLDPSLDAIIRYATEEIASSTMTEWATIQSDDRLHVLFRGYFNFLINSSDETEVVRTLLERYFHAFYPDQATEGTDLGALNLSSRAPFLIEIVTYFSNQNPEEFSNMFPWQLLNRLSVTGYLSPRNQSNTIRLFAQAPKEWFSVPENRSMVETILSTFKAQGKPEKNEVVEQDPSSLVELYMAYIEGSENGYDAALLCTRHALTSLEDRLAVMYPGTGDDKIIEEKTNQVRAYNTAQRVMAPVIMGFVDTAVDTEVMSEHFDPLEITALLCQITQLYDTQQQIQGSITKDKPVISTVTLDSFAPFLRKVSAEQLVIPICATRDSVLVAKYVARVRPGFMHERVLDVPVWLLTYRELLMVSPTDYQSHSQMRRYIYDKVFNASADNAIRILSQHGFTETELTDLFTWGSLWRNEEYFKYYDLFWMETQANSARLIFDEVFTTLSNPESTISDVKEAVGMLDQKVLSPISSGVKPLGNRSPQRFCQEQLVQLLHAVVAKNIPDDKLRATSTLVEYLNLTEWSKLNPLTQRKLLSASNSFYYDWRGEHYLRSTTIEDIVALCLENAIKEMQAIRALLNKDTFVYTLSENTHVRNTFFAMLETVLMPQLGTAALSQNQTTTIYAVLENTGVRMALGIHNPELLSRLRLNIAQAKTMKE